MEYTIKSFDEMAGISTRTLRYYDEIGLVEKTIAYKKGEIEMSNKEKFEGLKKEKIAQNEAKYGKEIREKYGDDTVDKSNEKFLNLTEEEMSAMKQTEDEMFEALKIVLKSKDLESEEAKMVYEKHKAWLHFTWPKYSKEAHAGLAQMYIYDERFAKYYNDRLDNQEAAQTLTDTITKYTK